jgi:hypothetical protein
MLYLSDAISRRGVTQVELVERLNPVFSHMSCVNKERLNTEMSFNNIYCYRAKCELSGQYIGKFQCKIGYGKMNPTTKIWIGGL